MLIHREIIANVAADMLDAQITNAAVAGASDSERASGQCQDTTRAPSRVPCARSFLLQIVPFDSIEEFGGGKVIGEDLGIRVVLE